MGSFCNCEKGNTPIWKGFQFENSRKHSIVERDERQRCETVTAETYGDGRDVRWRRRRTWIVTAETYLDGDYMLSFFSELYVLSWLLPFVSVCCPVWWAEDKCQLMPLFWWYCLLIAWMSQNLLYWDFFIGLIAPICNCMLPCLMSWRQVPSDNLLQIISY